MYGIYLHAQWAPRDGRLQVMQQVLQWSNTQMLHNDTSAAYSYLPRPSHIMLYTPPTQDDTSHLAHATKANMPPAALN